MVTLLPTLSMKCSMSLIRRIRTVGFMQVVTLKIYSVLCEKIGQIANHKKILRLLIIKCHTLSASISDPFCGWHFKTSPQWPYDATSVSFLLNLKHRARSRAPLSGHIVVVQLRGSRVTNRTGGKTAANTSGKMNGTSCFLHLLYIMEGVAENDPFWCHKGCCCVSQDTKLYRQSGDSAQGANFYVVINKALKKKKL